MTKGLSGYANVIDIFTTRLESGLSPIWKTWHLTIPHPLHGSLAWHQRCVLYTGTPHVWSIACRTGLKFCHSDEWLSVIKSTKLPSFKLLEITFWQTFQYHEIDSLLMNLFTPGLSAVSLYTEKCHCRADKWCIWTRLLTKQLCYLHKRDVFLTWEMDAKASLPGELCWQKRIWIIIRHTRVSWIPNSLKIMGRFWRVSSAYFLLGFQNMLQQTITLSILYYIYNDLAIQLDCEFLWTCATAHIAETTCDAAVSMEPRRWSQ